MKTYIKIILLILLTLLGSGCASVRPIPVPKPVTEEWHYSKPICDIDHINTLLAVYEEVQQPKR